MPNFYELFNLGERINGYCNGWFGRDDYETKTVISIQPKYVLFMYDDGQAAVLNIDECKNLARRNVESWIKNNPEE